ncbi:MAG: TolC family protein [Candidatus Binataceae bacterium]|nr:TolC family protein [Candidatus Binataceae bacterium]
MRYYFSLIAYFIGLLLLFSISSANAGMNSDTQSDGPLPLPAGSQITLRDAITIALKYHPEVAEAKAEYAAAREQVGEAQSYLGPQLSGVGGYLRSTDNGIGNTSYYNPYGSLPRMTGRNHDLPPNDTSNSWNTSNNFAAGVGLSQYLIDFGRRRGFVAERRYEASATAQAEQLVNLDLIFEVSQRYFDVLRARQLVRVFEKAVEERRFHLHEAQVRSSAGLTPELDVYVTKAEVERAQLHLVDARNAEADATVAFDNSLGLGGRSPDYHLADILTYTNIADTMPALLDSAFNTRPDFKDLKDQARAMGAQVTESRSDYFPTVNAVGGYSALGTGLPAANNFNVGVLITWPIFNSFLTSHQVAEAQYRQRALQSQIEDLRQHIILQVKTAFLDWQASLQRINRAEQTLAASRAELELAEKRYGAGLANIVELEDAQRNYTGDDAAYADALYGYSVAKATVDHATGRSLAGL